MKRDFSISVKSSSLVGIHTYFNKLTKVKGIFSANGGGSPQKPSSLSEYL